MLRGCYISTLSPLQINERSLYGFQITVGEPGQRNSKIYQLYCSTRNESQVWIQTLQELIL